MEKRIELEKRHRTPAQIVELNLDNCRSTTIEGLTEEFTRLKNLSLNGVGLTSLKGFPTLPKLEKLELGDNRITGGFQVLKDCARLSVLVLSNNKIKDLESLEPLKEIAKLKSLDLYRNDVTQLDDYRTKVFELLPNLTYLDGTDKNNKEAEEDSDDEEVKETNGRGGDDEDEDDSDIDEFENPALAGTFDPDSPLKKKGPAHESSGSDEEDDDEENLDDEEEDDDEVEVEDEEEEQAAAPGMGLKDIYRDDLDNDSEGEDYGSEEEDAVSDEDDDEDLDDLETSQPTAESAEGEASGEARGVKRAHEDSEGSD